MEMATEPIDIRVFHDWLLGGDLFVWVSLYFNMLLDFISERFSFYLLEVRFVLGFWIWKCFPVDCVEFSSGLGGIFAGCLEMEELSKGFCSKMNIKALIQHFLTFPQKTSFRSQIKPQNFH